MEDCKWGIFYGIYVAGGIAAGWTAMRALMLSSTEDFWRWYLQYAPNRYRIFQQILLCADNHIFSLGTWHAIIWGVSVSLLLIAMHPDLPESVSLLILIMMMSIQSLILSAPGYVLLYLVLKHREDKYAYALLPLIALIKEFLLYSAVIGILLLPVTDRKSSNERIIMWGIVSAIVYIVFVLSMGVVNAAPGGTPLVTTLYVVNVLQTGWRDSAALFAIIILAAILPRIRSKGDAVALFLSAAPVFVFGFFWEPQLWLPALIVLIERGRRAQHKVQEDQVEEEEEEEEGVPMVVARMK